MLLVLLLVIALGLVMVFLAPQQHIKMLGVVVTGVGLLVLLWGTGQAWPRLR